MTQRRARFWLFVAFLFGVLDGVLKYLAIARLPETGRVLVPIDFILHKNPGIAFNIPLPLPIVALFTVLVLGFLPFYMQRTWGKHPERSTAAGILGIGALGNLIDRLVNGFTTDYILLFGRSVINLSDILIVIGVLLLLLYTERRDNH